MADQDQINPTGGEQPAAPQAPAPINDSSAGQEASQPSPLGGGAPVAAEAPAKDRRQPRRGGGGGRSGGGGPRRSRDEADDGFQDNVVKIYRCSRVVKGGRKFSYGALVVVGDRSGNVGLGYGKANEVPQAVEKGIKKAKRGLLSVSLVSGTIPHPVLARCGSSQIRLIPASPGTGVIAAAAVRAVLELAGIHDILTKARGSTNPKNLCKATLNALKSLRTREQMRALRGVKI